MSWKIFLSIAVFALLLHCSSSGNNSSIDAQYVASIKEWHTARIESLKKPDGWLSLAGLFWLQAGENSFGSDASNDIVFPDATAPAHLGTLILQNGTVRLAVNSEAGILHQGQPAGDMDLLSDMDGEPTMLEWKTYSWYIIKRSETEFAVRLKNSAQPNLQTFTGIDTYPIDPAWRIAAQFTSYDAPREMAIQTVYGSTQQATASGELSFTIDGKRLSLIAIGEPGDEQYFVMFADRTNGHETYGSGRFLSVDAPDAKGKTFIDFNRAYNPPCAFTPYATCPLPPMENRLSVAIPAGEKDSGMH